MSNQTNEVEEVINKTGVIITENGFEEISKHKTKLKCKTCNGDKFVTPADYLAIDCPDCTPPTDSNCSDNKQKEQLIKVAPAESNNYNILNKKIKRNIALWIRTRKDTIDLDESLTNIIKNLLQQERQRERLEIYAKIAKTPIDKAHTYSSENADTYIAYDEGQIHMHEKIMELLSSNKPSNE